MDDCAGLWRTFFEGSDWRRLPVIISTHILVDFIPNPTL